MLRSLPNERLTPSYSAVLSAPLPQAGGGERSQVPPDQGGPDSYASGSISDGKKVEMRFTHTHPNPSIESRASIELEREGVKS